MVNYENGKIYKLVNDELNLTYYGSSCNELRKRLNAHKSKAKDKKCTSYKLFESGSVKIYLVEKFSCNDKMELNQRERFYIENNECVNKFIPCRTRKEWDENNKEKILLQCKEYKEDNKEKIKEYQKEYKEDNKEKLKQYKKEYYIRNKEKISLQKKEYYQKKKNK